MSLYDDLPGIISDAFSNADIVLSLELIKATSGTRTPGDVSGGTNATTTNYPCGGYVSVATIARLDGTLVSTGKKKISVLGATLPSGMQPFPGDQVVVNEGPYVGTYRITDMLEADPAAALFTVLAQ